ncbi:vesicle-associated membrane protein 5-like [Rana temporaria]|uniref:vesicle-associated membrane protein 5-like n=1 Tax=Rana temporaria TaxID=8407 RepID=UPI001AADD6DA|nr:vesicle-associated membrane protein 5-like [Rana temporaria]
MADQKIDMCQQEAEEVTVLMKNNVEKVFEREGKLENLEGRAEELKCMAGDFQRIAQKVERKTRCEKWRMYIICGAIVLVVVIVIIIILAVVLSGGGGGGEAPQNPTNP